VISGLVDFFPFNIASGPAFLGFFALFAISVFVDVGHGSPALNVMPLGTLMRPLELSTVSVFTPPPP
jgi:hypothetical protein